MAKARDGPSITYISQGMCTTNPLRSSPMMGKPNAATTQRRRKALAATQREEMAVTNPKTPVTDLLRKLKYDTDARIKNDQALLATLEDLIARVGEVEGLEERAATAKAQLASDKFQLEQTQAALMEAKGEYSALQAQLSVPATKLHELRTLLKSM